MKKDLTSVLTEEMDEEILKRMPEWFKVLRKAYEEKLHK